MSFPSGAIDQTKRANSRSLIRTAQGRELSATEHGSSGASYTCSGSNETSISLKTIVIIIILSIITVPVLTFRTNTSSSCNSCSSSRYRSS